MNNLKIYKKTIIFQSEVIIELQSNSNIIIFVKINLLGQYKGIVRKLKCHKPDNIFCFLFFFFRNNTVVLHVF